MDWAEKMSISSCPWRPQAIFGVDMQLSPLLPRCLRRSWSKLLVKSTSELKGPREQGHDPNGRQLHAIFRSWASDDIDAIKRPETTHYRCGRVVLISSRISLLLDSPSSLSLTIEVRAFIFLSRILRFFFVSSLVRCK